MGNMVSNRNRGSNITRLLLENIGGAIVRGEYDVGEALPTEAKLTATFNASRTVTREAVKMLTAKGLLRAWPRRGTIVQEELHWNLLDADVMAWILERRPSMPLLVEFLTMRLVIEPAAAEMAAKSGRDLSGISRALNRMRSAKLNSNDSEALTADSLFHASILQASGNRFFAQMAPLVDTALRMTIRITNRLESVRVANIEEHEEIYFAIRGGAAEQARTLIHTHVSRALSLINKNPALILADKGDRKPEWN